MSRTDGGDSCAGCSHFFLLKGWSGGGERGGGMLVGANLTCSLASHWLGPYGGGGGWQFYYHYLKASEACRHAALLCLLPCSYFPPAVAQVPLNNVLGRV